MEFIKNFVVGIAVVILIVVFLGVILLLQPLLFIAGSLILITARVIVFLAICVGAITLIGYLVRKLINK